MHIIRETDFEIKLSIRDANSQALRRRFPRWPRWWDSRIRRCRRGTAVSGGACLAFPPTTRSMPEIHPLLVRISEFTKLFRGKGGLLRGKRITWYVQHHIQRFFDVFLNFSTFLSFGNTIHFYSQDTLLQRNGNRVKNSPD